jgi:hypothetical protein
MKSYLPAVLVGVLVALAAALSPRDGAAQVQKAKVQWEYKVVPAGRVYDLAPKGSSDRISDGLSVLGSDGWELVAVEPPSRDIVMFTYLFKRPKGP